ncbi:MAG: nucleotidyltransferase domain-containing protein [Candidatus Nezhaarchaeota archaeon]|nr:nucleotidyltransferase domain-containing protein [Candidatus Nezhaarchaeota archaeon]MCX8141452.1 nucleotidyltransferase domain-containing protein [Candidatus Nezhaarchaeota archaeon]MDW8049718.1 nucleotidyltransferase domain-containing protein [Nitrososphaerota archaeon]
MHPKAREEVERLIDKVREVGVRVNSVIVFGSAVRGNEFKPGVSDIDVIVIVERLNSSIKEALKEVGNNLELGIFTRGQFLDLWLSGDPLAHMIWLEGVAVLDDGFYSALKAREKPKLTELTIMKLRFWGLRNLAEAMRPGVERVEGLRRLHHAVRDFARMRIVRDKRLFTLTDKEIMENLDSVFSRIYRDFLERLHYNVENYEQLMFDALQIMEQLDGKPLPRLDEILSLAKEV